MTKRLIRLLFCTGLLAGLLTVTALADNVDASVDVTPGGSQSAVVIVPGGSGGGGDTTQVVIVPAEDQTQPWSPAIGDTVRFANHEWYIIGTDTEGVTAPEGCYTLFAKNNDFGSVAFRANGGDKENSTAYNYKDSDLYNQMNNIANTFTPGEKAYIVARATLDDIKGDTVTEQLMWPIGQTEASKINSTLKQFDVIYWGRTGVQTTYADDAFVGQRSGSGSYYSVIAYNTDGSERWENNVGILGSWASTASNEFAVRPALYVKTEAVERVDAGVEAVPLTGGRVNFGNQNWYIVGMGVIGPVPGPANTLTLFSTSNLSDSNGDILKEKTEIYYSTGFLCKTMQGVGETLGFSEKEQSLIVNRTLTTEDGITGDPVTTPFWPLSKSEFEGVQEENQSLLTAKDWGYWLRTDNYFVTKEGTLSTTATSVNGWSYAVRPAFYLNLSDLFFAAGYGNMISVGTPPRKIQPPTASFNTWAFVLRDTTLSLSMTAAAGQTGESLTFQYSGTPGDEHYLSYVLEKTNAPGIPAYYGCATLLGDSGSGEVTVPLLGPGSNLEDGDYTLRFYTEDRFSGNVFFASDTVDLTIHVEDGQASITALGDVTAASAISGVTITPSNPTLEAGQQLQFTATVTPSGEAWCDQTVSWTVTGAQNSGTRMSSTGLLTVALDETASSLTVTATSKQDSSKSASATVAVEPHSHSGTLVSGTPATCTTAGVRDYYTCTCGKAFENQACTKEITNLDTWKVIPALPHQGVFVPGTPATCTADGVKDYYECSTCHQYFEDEACTKPITDLDSWKAILALGHSWSDSYLAEHADTEKHYHVCTVCSEKDTGEAHQYDNDQDSTCDICGYVRQTAPPVAAEYTVIFDANGGAGMMTAQTFTNGVEQPLAANTFTRSGYTFAGWNTAANGSGTTYENEAKLTLTDGGLTLYAQWTANPVSGGSSGGGSTPTKTPSQQAADKIESAKDGATVEITLKSGQTKLDKEVFETLAGRDVTLVIHLNGNVDWTIDGLDIAQDADLTDLDMGVSMNTSTIPVDIINALTGEVGTVQLTLAHDGEFGFALTLTAPLGKDYADLWANLYHYDEDTGKLVFQTSARIGADGTADLRFTHASEYAIVIDDRDHTPKAFPFADVRETDWFYDAVDFVYQNGLMNGTSGTAFAPDGTMTRAMLVTILHRQAGEPVVGYAMPFDDVAEGTWYTEAVRWAASESIVTGTSATTFEPDAPVTREQFAAILYRYAQQSGADVSVGEDTNILSYADALEISEYAIPAMQWACGAGVIEGSGGSLNPQDSATRAEAATMLMRFVQTIA